MGPVNALFDRLGMDRSDIRVATQLNWSRRNLTDADCHVIADIFRANSAYTINPLVGMFSLNHNNVGDEGLVAIADALKLSNSLLAKCTDVWLNNNSPRKHRKATDSLFPLDMHASYRVEKYEAHIS